MAQQSVDPVIFRKEFETSRGVMRIAIDLSRMTSDIGNYTMKLQQARGIPMNIENLPPTDPVVQFVVKNMPWVGADKVLWVASEHYRTLMQEVTSNAGLIALTLTSDKSLWDAIPEPYEKPKSDEFAIEGDVNIPEPERNLAHPTERRLKLVLDLMLENPAYYADIQDAISTALILLQRNAGVETDDDGFRNGSPRKPVRRKAVSDNVESEA
jgi:hypothetical protein